MFKNFTLTGILKLLGYGETLESSNQYVIVMNGESLTSFEAWLEEKGFRGATSDDWRGVPTALKVELQKKLYYQLDEVDTRDAISLGIEPVEAAHFREEIQKKPHLLTAKKFGI
jgi:hypothetical protein